MSAAYRALLLVTAVTLLGSWEAPALSSGDPMRPAFAEFHGSSVPAATTIPHGNLSIPLVLANATFVAGTHIVARYQFQVVSWPVGLANLSVWVDSELVSFPTSTGGTLHETIRVQNVTISNGSLSDPNASSGSATVGPGGVAFTSGAVASLSSQLLAVTDSAKWGKLKMSFRWDWESIPVSGTTSYSPWSAFQTFTPPEHVTVWSAGPAKIKPGNAFTVCIAAPHDNRTFSLHMEIANPYRAIAWNTSHVLSTWTGPYCWSVMLPAGFTKVPNALLVHLWEYNTLPSILYIFHTRAV